MGKETVDLLEHRVLFRIIGMVLGGNLQEGRQDLFIVTYQMPNSLGHLRHP